MKWRIIKISNLILALLLVAFTIGYTYAWFADYYSIDIKLYVSPDGGYFESGDGTENTPYVISNYRHLYNLAWLQNSGKFNQTDDNGNYTQTYFKLKNDINMEISTDNICVIPPIGNDDNPFIGVFDGNGCTISNLIVSTDKNKLTNFPVESASGYEFSNYVGLFGKTGTYIDSTSNETCGADIKNFILNDPILEVATGSNTLYSTATNESYCGLAIGYVAYKASSIGVIGGTLAVKKTGYSTYNSILGTVADDVDISVTGGSVDSDKGYFIPDTFYSYLKTVYDNVDMSVPYVSKYEKDSNGDIAINLTQNVWLTSVKGISGKNTFDYLGLGSFSILTKGTFSFENTGLDTGSAINAISITYTSSTAKSDANSSSESFEMGGSSTKAQTIVDTKGEQIYSFSSRFYTQNSPTSKTFSDAIVYSEDAKTDNGTTTGSVINSTATTYYTFNNNILVNITDSKNSKLIIVAENRNSGNSRYMAMTKIIDSDSSGTSGTIDLSKFSFSNNYSKLATDYIKTGISTDQVKSEAPVLLYLNGVTYYEVDLAKLNLGNGIYTINLSGGGVNIYYLAVTGIDGDGSADDEYDVSSIDFIYSDVSITQEDIKDSSENVTVAKYNFVYNYEFYTPTGTMIAFDAVDTTGAIIILAFSRPDGGTDTSNCTIYVSYYANEYGEPTSSVSGKESLTPYDTYKEENNTYVFSNSE